MVGGSSEDTTMTNAGQTATQAIRESIAQSRIVHLDHDAGVLDELTVLADDSADTDDEHEFWGATEAGDEWRVHVRRAEHGGETRRYTYSVYDADPAASGVDAWPDHDGETIEADSDAEAVEHVRDIVLDVCAASCDPADGYEVGDVLHALVWDADGMVVGTLRRELTAEDLGVEDADEVRS